MAVTKQKRTELPKRPTNGMRSSRPEAITVTDENLEALSNKFDSLSKDDPEYKHLGDALHRYMIG